MTLNKSLRKAGRRLGFDVRKVQPFQDDYETLVGIIHGLGVGTVLDVGANDGGFAASLFAAGYNRTVTSFEPLPDANRRLVVRAMGNRNWFVRPPVALGEAAGTVTLHVAGNSSSSSILPMATLHTDVAPHSANIGTITVRVDRLDALITDSTDPLFLKIDTQGYERQVLDGASGIMDRVIGLRLEMSFAELYAGQELFDGMYTRVRNLGFELWEITPVLRDPRSGRMLQCDATFVRSGAA